MASTEGLAIFNCVAGNGNATAEDEATRHLCTYPTGNCTDGTTGLRRGGHFSKCPEEYKHYCVKGRCRYVTEEKIPACVYVDSLKKMCHLSRATFWCDYLWTYLTNGICERGYTGSRCERLDLFYLRGDQSQIVVVFLIAAMVMLIILIVCICTGTQ
ncbi:hypothetical protein lerEdw1_017526 [Lerista edwardsae]|nr:hypothetical protein lerEdw1_017526 [Lerista edwardsae]